MTALALLASAACRTDDPGFAEVPPAEELWEDGMRALEGASLLGLYRFVDYDRAIDIFQSIVDNYPYSHYAVEAELQIADAYFAQGKYEEALSYYRDFSELHPQHERVPYAIWRAARSHEERVLAPHRDQSATREALVFLDRLLLRHPRSEYAARAETLWRELQIRLAESEEGVGDFYAARGEYEAAAERYRSLLDDYPGLGLDARVLFKLGECYVALRRIDEADRLFRTVVEHYADSDYAYRARRELATNLPGSLR